MQIHSLQQAAAAQQINRANTAQPRSPANSAPAAQTASADQLDLSPEAQALSQSQASQGTDSGIRVEKVAALREAIASGTYETPEKLDAALDRMLDTFA